MSDSSNQNETGQPDTATGYDFTKAYEHWSEPFRHNARRNLYVYRGKPFRYLEIGVHEGRSLVWMAQNILTHPDSYGIGVDVWESQIFYDRAKHNVQFHEDHIGLIRSTLVGCCTTFQMGSFDCIYIDGDHTWLPVVADTVNAWPLLRSGGIMAWDDTEWDDPRYQVADALEWMLKRLPHRRLNADKQVWVRKL